MVVLVAGSPAVGKSTWVRANAPNGAVVVDMDRLAEALGSPDPHDHPPAVRRAAQLARAALIEQVANIPGDVWVISTEADPAARAELAARLGAERTVVLTAPADEVHARADDAGRPDRWHKLIDERSSRFALSDGEELVELSPARGETRPFRRDRSVIIAPHGARRSRTGGTPSVHRRR